MSDRDQGLIAALRAGEEQAFTRFFNAYVDAMYRLALGLLGDEAIAQLPESLRAVFYWCYIVLLPPVAATRRRLAICLYSATHGDGDDAALVVDFAAAREISRFVTAILTSSGKLETLPT